MDHQSKESTLNDSASTRMLYGDTAKLTLADDEFGLNSIAASVAALLSNRIAADGYTIGIEGKWGSGKTSLTNFIIEEIKKTQSLTLKIFRFEPWLVGDRDSLIKDFFNGLKAKIAEFRDDPILVRKISNEDPGLLERLSGSIERYQNLLDDAGAAIASIGNFDPTQHVRIVSWAFKAASSVCRLFTNRFKQKPATLEGLRNAIKANRSEEHTSE